jgi:hypothetical protein
LVDYKSGGGKLRVWFRPDFRHYAMGIEGRVKIESEWAARKRERAKQQPHSSQNKA